MISPPRMVAFARTRPSLSLQPLLAARRFAIRVAAIEAEYEGVELGDFWQELLDLSLAIATLSVVALESNANEIFFDSEALSQLSNYASLAGKIRKVERQSVLAKFSLGLELHAGRTLQMDNPLVQRVDALISLRNAVVHFRSEWSDSRKFHREVSEQLNGHFAGSPFLPNEPLFPSAWASGSFAEWAIDSAVQFIDFYYAETGLANPIAPFRQRILGTPNIAA